MWVSGTVNSIRLSLQFRILLRVLFVVQLRRNQHFFRNVIAGEIFQNHFDRGPAHFVRKLNRVAQNLTFQNRFLPRFRSVKTDDRDLVLLARFFKSRASSQRGWIVDGKDRRQIGVRDEAALLGGVGRCGRELCCSTWLPDLKPVSLQLAKDQRLSLNPAQISGCCGRLMCCLMYEHKTYVESRRRFQREGKVLRTARGQEKVVGVDILQETVTVRDGSGQRRTVSLDDLKREVAEAPRPPR